MLFLTFEKTKTKARTKTNKQTKKKSAGKEQAENSLSILLLSARDEIIVYLIGWDKLCEVLEEADSQLGQT